MTPRSRVFACLGGLVFATVAVIPALVALRTSPGFPVQAFTVDDGLYLQRSIGAWEGNDAYEWTYFENATTDSLAEVVLQRPNAVVDVAAGALADAFDLSAAGLAIALDWMFGGLSFALFVLVFLCFTPDRWLACGAAAVAVCYCGAFVPDPVLSLPNGILPWAVNQPYVDHARPPFRAVYTQAGYPLFLAGILLLARRFTTRSFEPPALFAIGALCGLNGHTYFFPWLTSIAIGMSLPVADVLVNRHASLVRAVASSAAFLAGWTLGSAGVLWITLANRTTGIIGGEELGRFWFLPVEHLAIALVLVMLARRDPDPRRSRLLAFVGVVLALEFPLMNVQTVLRQGIAPYHFSSFYLHPFVSGGALVLLVGWLKEAMSMRLLAQFVCAAPLVAFSFDAALRTRAALSPLPIAEDLGWLVQRLRGEPEDTVFAMVPVEHPYRRTSGPDLPNRNLPNFVTAQSGRYTLFQEWMFEEMDVDTDLRRELGTSWLLSGTMRPLWTHPEPIELPGDLFTLTTTYFELRRREKFERHRALLGRYTPCDFVRELRTDLFVHDPGNDGPMAPPGERFLTFEATSPHGGFDVYRFDRERARRELCTGT